MKIIHVVEPFAAGLVTFMKILVENHEWDEHIVIHGERKNVMRAEEVKKLFPSSVTFIPWTKAQRNISPLRDTKAFLELYSILSEHRDADIVHLHSSKAGFLGRMACFILGIRNVIFTPHGVSFINEDISRMKSFLYASLERFGNLFPGKVIASSESERRALESRHIASRLIANGTSITPYDFEVNPEKPFRVVTCGRIAPQKAPNLFNRIARQMEHVNDVEFVWIGNGIEREKIDAKNVRVTGWVSNEEVHAELEKADLYISTARWEGLPLAVLEAMNVGLPLLLSKCIGNDDLIVDGVNGYQFNNEKEAINHIINLKDQPELQEDMSKRSYELCASRFRKENSAKAYKYLYLELVHNMSTRFFHQHQLSKRKTVV